MQAEQERDDNGRLMEIHRRFMHEAEGRATVWRELLGKAQQAEQQAAAPSNTP